MFVSTGINGLGDGDGAGDMNGAGDGEDEG
jgi:hypothetical protein